MTRTTAAATVTTTSTRTTDAALKDMAYILQLTRRVSADIRADKLAADRATPAKLATV